MNIEPYLQRIYKEFSDFKGMSTRIPKQGMDHAAIIFGDEWIVRFPKLQEYVDGFPHEVRLLDFIHTRLTLPIPHYERIASDQSFGAYRLIIGEECTPEVFQSLSTAAKSVVISQIAQFLSELHGIPAEQLKKFPLATVDERADLRNLVQEYTNLIEPRITDDEKKKCELFFRERTKMIETVPRQALVHRDFAWWHILIDQNHEKLAGIIDFGDTIIADPAGDFGALWAYGRECVQEVIRQYSPAVDDQFLHRSLLGFKRFGIRDFFHALKGNYGTVEGAYAFFQKTLEAKLS